jgi:hypothetical protein
LRRAVTERYALHVEVDPWIARIVCMTPRQKFELLNTLGVFTACISADRVQWLRAGLDRFLTTGNVIKLGADGDAVSQATVLQRIPDALECMAAPSRILEMFRWRRGRQAGNFLHCSGRFLLPDAMMQFAWRVELATRAAKMAVLEIADAALQ